MAIQTLTVSSAAELNQALSSATGGETILLAAGDYGRLNLNGTQFASNVTIKSADANTPATISEMRLNGVSNLSFDSVLFDYTFNGEATSYRPFQIQNSSGITVTNSVFSGDLAQGVSVAADGYGSGKGLDVRGGTDIVISGNEFFDWWKGLTVGASSNVTVSGNDVYAIRSDGMYFDGNQSVTIEKNYIHDFGGSLTSGDHRDMIQFSKLLGPSSDITIQDNVFDMGTGSFGQVLFMGNGKTSPADPAMFYQNVLIDNNLIYGAQPHGITVSGARDLTISSNTVLAVDRGATGGITIPRINVTSGSQNVTVDQNVVSTVTGYNGQADWTVTNNAYVQNTNPGAADYYDNVFIYNATAAQDGYNQYGVVPGSDVDNLNAGSTLMDLFPVTYDAWVGSTGVATPGTGGSSTTGTGSTDTSGTDTTDTGGTDTSGTDTTDTGDTGTSGTGTTGTGDTGTSGTGTTGTGGAGTSGTDTSGTGASSQTPMVFDDFVLDIAGLPSNEQAALQGDAVVTNTATGGSAISFDGNRDVAKIGRLEQFESSDQIAFTVEFSRDTADGSTQRLVWNHKKIGLALTDDGLVAYVQNNDAKFWKGFKAPDIGLNDTDTHQITLMVDQTADRLQVIVDDQLVIDETGTDFDFVGSGGREWGWSLGTKWGKYVDGEVSAFAVDDDVQFIDQIAPADDLFA